MRGGIGRQMGVGAGVGFAFPGEDFENPNLSFEERVKSAAFGAVGAGLFMKAPSVLGGVASMAWKGRGVAGAVGMGAGSMALGAGKFAFNNPLTAMGIAGGIYGATQLNATSVGTSPTMSGARVNTAYNQQAIAMDEMTMGGAAGLGMVGTAPQMMNNYHRALQQSTQGLTQGLHRGRHG